MYWTCRHHCASSGCPVIDRYESPARYWLADRAANPISNMYNFFVVIFCLKKVSRVFRVNIIAVIEAHQNRRACPQETKRNGSVETCTDSCPAPMGTQQKNASIPNGHRSRESTTCTPDLLGNMPVLAASVCRRVVQVVSEFVFRLPVTPATGCPTHVSLASLS